MRRKQRTVDEVGDRRAPAEDRRVLDVVHPAKNARQAGQQGSPSAHTAASRRAGTGGTHSRLDVCSMPTTLLMMRSSAGSTASHRLNASISCDRTFLPEFWAARGIWGDVGRDGRRASRVGRVSKAEDRRRGDRAKSAAGQEQRVRIGRQLDGPSFKLELAHGRTHPGSCKARAGDTRGQVAQRWGRSSTGEVEVRRWATGRRRARPWGTEQR